MSTSVGFVPARYCTIEISYSEIMIQKFFIDYYTVFIIRFTSFYSLSLSLCRREERGGRREERAKRRDKETKRQRDKERREKERKREKEKKREIISIIHLMPNQLPMPPQYYNIIM